jgi:hypothetical protein
MSTKRLARSVIEGGRASYNKFDRRTSNRDVRVKTRQECHRLVNEAGGDADFDFSVERRHVYKGFDDKLAPLYRYLDSSVGRNFSKVVSEILSRVDTRTTAGRHIVFCHALPSVRTNDLSVRYARFGLDRQGRLTRLERKRYRWPALKEPLPCSATALSDWLSGRAVGTRGAYLYWFEETVSGGFRQAGSLSASEKAFYESLPQWFRDENAPEERKKRLALERAKGLSCVRK